MTIIDDKENSIKRIFLRLRSEGSDLNATEIINKYLAEAGLPQNTNPCHPHWVHEQPQEDRVYHLVIDLHTDRAPPDVKIHDIPHELYRVHFRQNRVDPYYPPS